MILPKFQNIAAIIYVFVLYGLGIACIISPLFQLNILGVLFITHSLVISTSLKYPWLNLLVLNFSYHNAHHHNMSCPWHELPALHTKLYGDSTYNILPFKQLVINYHRFRLDRLFSEQGEFDDSGNLNLDSFTGAIAVSLLTPPPY